MSAFFAALTVRSSISRIALPVASALRRELAGSSQAESGSASGGLSGRPVRRSHRRPEVVGGLPVSIVKRDS